MQGIPGIGHVALKARDLERLPAFFRDRLSCPETRRLNQPDGSVSLVCLRIADEQVLEIFPGADSGRSPGGNGSCIPHLCLGVENIEDLDGNRVESWR